MRWFAEKYLPQLAVEYLVSTSSSSLTKLWLPLLIVFVNCLCQWFAFLLIHLTPSTTNQCFSIIVTCLTLAEHSMNLTKCVRERHTKCAVLWLQDQQLYLQCFLLMCVYMLSVQTSFEHFRTPIALLTTVYSTTQIETRTHKDWLKI